jgi:hypothetical protein
MSVIFFWKHILALLNVSLTFLFFWCFLFYSMLSYSVRFHSAEGMVVISVKDMLSLSSERTDKSRERFVYVVSILEAFTFVLPIEKLTAWTNHISLNYGNSQSVHENIRLCRIFVPSVRVNSLTLPLSFDFVRCDDWANPISFKWARKVCLFF